MSDIEYLNESVSGGFGPANFGLFSGMIPDRVSAIQIPISDRGLGSSEIPLDDSMAATEVDSKVKTKLLSMWNNVKYGLCSFFFAVTDFMFTIFYISRFCMS